MARRLGPFRVTRKMEITWRIQWGWDSGLIPSYEWLSKPPQVFDMIAGSGEDTYFGLPGLQGLTPELGCREFVPVKESRRRFQWVSVLIHPRRLKAVLVDGPDKEVMESIGIQEDNTVIISFGEDLAASTLITIHLKDQIGKCGDSRTGRQASLLIRRHAGVG